MAQDEVLYHLRENEDPQEAADALIDHIESLATVPHLYLFPFIPTSFLKMHPSSLMPMLTTLLLSSLIYETNDPPYRLESAPLTAPLLLITLALAEMNGCDKIAKYFTAAPAGPIRSMSAEGPHGLSLPTKIRLMLDLFLPFTSISLGVHVCEGCLVSLLLVLTLHAF